jgi:hypothetical protein
MAGAGSGWAGALVAAQLVAYLTVYSRLVRGRWGLPFSARAVPVARSDVADKEAERAARFG